MKVRMKDLHDNGAKMSVSYLFGRVAPIGSSIKGGRVENIYCTDSIIQCLEFRIKEYSKATRYSKKAHARMIAIFESVKKAIEKCKLNT